MDSKRQSLQTVLVFQKGTKNKSTLDDILAFEEGDLEISPSIWNIDAGRVPTEVKKERFTNSNKNIYDGNSLKKSKTIQNTSRDGDIKGRYPSQLFVDEEMAEVLDEQSGNKDGVNKGNKTSKRTGNICYGDYGNISGATIPKDSGGSSKILHKIPHDEKLIKGKKNMQNTVKIDNIDALEKIKSLPDNSQDIIFADPPYALGSTVKIDKKTGKPYYKEARDFMDKWEMPDEKFWEEFMQEAQRVLKYGGRVLFFGVDRQLMLFQYYATMADLETKQSLYWYFISNFPKSTDVSKQIDKRLGVDREVVGTTGKTLPNTKDLYEIGEEKTAPRIEENITAPASDLGKKYDGWKYSLAPLKQTLETIMVWQKGTKNKSTLDDILGYEEGDLEISPSIWNIDAGRVPTSESLGGGGDDVKVTEQMDGFDRPWMHDEDAVNAYKERVKDNVKRAENLGRYPSQLFVDEEMAEVLDEQSGVLATGGNGNYQKSIANYSATSFKFPPANSQNYGGGDSCSKILHKIKYLDEDVDLVMYSPKVSQKEREGGCTGEAKPAGVGALRDNGRGTKYVLSTDTPEDIRKEIESLTL